MPREWWSVKEETSHAPGRIYSFWPMSRILSCLPLLLQLGQLKYTNGTLMGERKLIVPLTKSTKIYLITYKRDSKILTPSLIFGFCNRHHNCLPIISDIPVIFVRRQDIESQNTTTENIVGKYEVPQTPPRRRWKKLPKQKYQQQSLGKSLCQWPRWSENKILQCVGQVLRSNLRYIKKRLCTLRLGQRGDKGIAS